MLKIKVCDYYTGEFQETTLTPETTTQGECIIGRSPNCDLVLASSEVSRVHGRIKFQNEQYYFTDLGSTDGSRINNEEVKVNQSYALKQDDMIRIAGFVLWIAAVDIPQLGKGAATASEQLDSARWWTKGDLTVRCIGVIDETADVKTFRFVANSPMLFNYQPGQFVTLDLEINGNPVLRSYSISSTPSRPHTLEITVKRVPPSTDAPNGAPGLVSNWLHDNITVGSEVKLTGPMGKFTCFANPSPKLLMISAGSGITPMMSMSQWLHDTAAQSDIVFLHSARSPRDIIFRQELELMAARHPNFRLAITTTRSEPGEAWLGFSGRLTEAMLQVIAPDFRERTVYVCGPDTFMQGVKAMLSGLAFPMQNYYEESFGSPKKAKTASKPVVKEPSIPPVKPYTNGHSVATEVVKLPPPTPASTSSQPAVFFAQSGKEVSCDGEESILELAEQEGVKIRSSCKQGVCGACKKRKLEGEVKYEENPEALDNSEQEAGYILTCVAYPVGRVAVEA